MDTKVLDPLKEKIRSELDSVHKALADYETMQRQGKKKNVQDLFVRGKDMVDMLTRALRTLNKRVEWLDDQFHQMYKAFFERGLPNERLLPLEQLLDLESCHLEHLRKLESAASQVAYRDSDEQERWNVLFSPVGVLVEVQNSICACVSQCARDSASAKAGSSDVVDAIAKCYKTATAKWEQSALRFVRNESLALHAYRECCQGNGPLAAKVSPLVAKLDFVATRTDTVRHLKELLPLLEKIMGGDHAAGAEALKALEEHKKHCKREQKASERVARLLCLKPVLQNFEPGIINFSREVLCIGAAEVADSRKEHVLYIFNDVWVLGTLSSDRKSADARAWNDLATGLKVVSTSGGPGTDADPRKMVLALKWNDTRHRSSPRSSPRLSPRSSPRSRAHSPEQTVGLVERTVKFQVTQVAESMPSDIAAAISEAAHRRAQTKVFGEPLKGVLPFLKHMQRVIEESGGLKLEGIYRGSVCASELAICASAVDAGYLDNITDPMTAASLVRRWLRQLPAPLLTHELSKEFARTVALAEQGDKAMLDALWPLIAVLPAPNREVLGYFMRRMLLPVDRMSAENKMNAKNIATILSPSIFGDSAGGTSDINAVNADVSRWSVLVEFMIQHAEELFPGA